MLGLTREQLSDSVPNVVPLTIIVALTALFIAYNPWGWEDWFLITEIFGLHLVPLIVLGPVTYVLVKLVSESTDGESETANRVRKWFAADSEEESEESEEKHDTGVPASR
ncbi:DUF6684 family protein [Haladaptatus sp. CMAA 1911]|uniref:DUF6684 family protein n=1 Tax=unclassified Haladaptatus TaxID=2622732 RepID=UPI003754A7A0